MAEPFEGDAHGAGYGSGRSWCEADADSSSGMHRTTDEMRRRALEVVKIDYKRYSFSAEQLARYVAGFIDGYTAKKAYIDDYRARGHYPEIWDT